MWRDNVPAKVIAAEFGIAVGSHTHYCRKFGLPKRNCLVEIDEAKFALLWEEGVSIDSMAAILDVSRGTIARQRKRQGLKPRPAGRWRVAGGAKAAEDAPAPQDAPPSPPEMPPHPFWTPERDAWVLSAGGTYIGIDDLAARFGKPRDFVLQRWHKLRAAA